EVEERKYENPNKVDEVPVKPHHLDAVSQMLRILPIERRTRRQQRVDKDNQTANDVEPVKTGNREIARQVRIMPWEKHSCHLCIRLFHLDHFVRFIRLEESRMIILRGVRLRVNGV